MNIRKWLSGALCACIALGIIQTYVLAAEVHSGLENFDDRQNAEVRFLDVDPAAWFAPYIEEVSQKGLMKGSSVELFNPLGNVTLAETVTIASRLHSIYYTGSEHFEQGPVWYQVYMDYAEHADIYFPKGEDYSRQATRAEFARILASAFPAEALAEINDLADGDVPDIPMDMAGSGAIYVLYRAGVLTGNDRVGTFAPYSPILRSEVAAIVSRMADAERRVRFELEKEEALDDRKENGRLPTSDEENKGSASEDVKPQHPVAAGPVFHVGATEAEVGQKQVAVAISVRNNPGISALALHLSYDSDILLTGIVYNDQISGETMAPQTMKNPTKLIWLSPFENVTEDFVLATAYFTISDGAQKGDHSVSVTYNADDVYDLAEENVYFEVVHGTISVK